MSHIPLSRLVDPQPFQELHRRSAADLLPRLPSDPFGVGRSARTIHCIKLAAVLREHEPVEAEQ